jgi:alpha-tubulin suppressor-like RCC1 family protein
MRVAGDHQFSDIAAGSSFTCAIDMVGEAFCWGGGQRGQLGAGAFFDFAYEPQSVAGAHRFISVVAGKEHACGIDDLGAAWCWGDNSYGQLGDSTVNYASVPVRVAGDHVFKQLGAGAESNTTCGVTTDGAAFCWGFNGRGPLAHGVANPSSVPVKVPRLSRLRSIDPGTGEACALDNRGDVYCWGSNAFGQLGLGYPVRDTLIPTPAQRVSTDEKFVSLSVGDGRACAVSRTGATYCWGSADKRLLGVKPDDTCTDRQISCARSPSVVRDASLTQVALGPNDRICGAGRYPTTAPVYCWGRDFAQPAQLVVQAKAVAIWQTASAGSQNGR